jgi:hypothetical protein
LPINEANRARATVTEYFDCFPSAVGAEWFVVTRRLTRASRIAAAAISRDALAP